MRIRCPKKNTVYFYLRMASSCNNIAHFPHPRIILPPQTKFGARKCFYSRLSFCSERKGNFCLMSLPVSLPGPVFLWGVSVKGGLPPGGPLSIWSLSGGLCPGLSLSSWSLSRKESLSSGGLCSVGVSVQWGSLSEGLCP